jgi:hypothetical protein
LFLGEIAVELKGFEAITGKGLDYSQTFLSSKINYQGERKRPSEAVHGPCKDGYYLANKGKTVFTI